MTTSQILDLTKTLSDREKIIYEWLCHNLTNEEIAQKVGLSKSGVKFHLKSIYRKLGLNDKGKKVSMLVRQSVLLYSGTRIEQSYQSKEEKYYSREEILNAAKKLSWYDPTRIEEILVDLFTFL